MRKLLVILLLALTAAKIAAVLARGPVTIELDALGYWRLSTLVLEGDLLMMAEPIAFRTPVYPWFLAAIRLFAGSHALAVIVVAQGVLALVSITIAAQIAKRITKLPQAFAWTLLVSLPAVSSVVFNAALLSETLFVFLLMLNLLSVLDYAKYGSAGRCVWVGVTFALALLTRPIVILIWVPHLVFLIYIHWRKNRRLGAWSPHRVRLRSRMLHGMIATMVVAAMAAPWMLRNQTLFGSLFLTEFLGRNIWIVTFQDGSGAGLELPDSANRGHLSQRLARVESTGNSTTAIADSETETIETETIETWRQTWTVSKALTRSGLDDAQSDRLMKQVAFDAIRANPETFAYKAFRRVVNFWRCAATELPPQGLDDGNFVGNATWKRSVPPIDWAIHYRWSQSVLANTLLTATLAGAAMILIVNGPTRPYGIWFALLLLYLAVVTGILEIPAYRYRMVVEPLVATIIGSSIAVILSRRRRPAKSVRPQQSKRLAAKTT